MRHFKNKFEGPSGEQYITYASSVGLVWVDASGSVEVLWFKWNHVEKCDSLLDGLVLINYNGVL